MVAVIAGIKTCHEKNVGIMGRIEALKEVTTFEYYFDGALNRFDLETSEGRHLSFEIPEEKTVQDVALFLSKWRFPGTLRADFPPFLQKALDWHPVSWDDLKSLNDWNKKVALSLGECFLDKDGDLTEKEKAELAKILDNLKRDQLVGAQSRLAQIKEKVSQRVEALNACLRECGVLPSCERAFGNSTLIPPHQRRLMSSWYPGEWHLIYRGTRDGMSAEAFHSKADGRGPTVTVISCNGNIFGGIHRCPGRVRCIASGSPTAQLPFLSCRAFWASNLRVCLLRARSGQSVTTGDTDPFFRRTSRVSRGIPSTAGASSVRDSKIRVVRA